ncbi:MAG: GspH/FimT family pseudopilin [Magnetococcales bacterium]|nr:GspH/FimT family pseudopilin [Magnetococcales bacterium]
MKRNSAQSGFTLVELLIGVAVVAIMVAVGMPHLRTSLLNQKIKSAVSDYHLSLLFARSEAIKRNSSVSVVPNTTWNGGWTVQYGTTVLKTVDPYTELAISGPSTNITFQSNGRPTATVSDFQAYVSGNTRVTMRCVTVSTNGMPHIKIDGDNDTTNGCT